MHSVVCIKQVPDSSQISIHPETNTIMRQGVPSIVNPYDLHALEAALRLRDQHGGQVTVVTMGPRSAATALRRCLAHGADQARLITDRSFAGSDTLATALVLAHSVASLHRVEPVDVVFCGKQTIDGDTGQVGPGIAGRLGLDPLSYVVEIEAVDPVTREIVVRRRLGSATQIIESRLPCLISMLEGANRVRFGSLEDVLRAEQVEIPRWSAADIGLDGSEMVGLKGSPTRVRRVFAPPLLDRPTQRLDVTDRGPDGVAGALLEELASGHPELLATIAGMGGNPRQTGAAQENLPC